jgi:6,7-dimethyl-8-ribityllumazine synthase
MTNRPARIGFVVADFNRNFTHMTGMEVDEGSQFFYATIHAITSVLDAYNVPLSVRRSLKKSNIDAFVTIFFVIDDATNHDLIVGQNATWKIFDSLREFDEQVMFRISRLDTTQFEAEDCIEYDKQVIELDSKMNWWFEK